VQERGCQGKFENAWGILTAKRKKHFSKRTEQKKKGPPKFPLGMHSGGRRESPSSFRFTEKTAVTDARKPRGRAVLWKETHVENAWEGQRRPNQYPPRSPGGEQVRFSRVRDSGEEDSAIGRGNQETYEKKRRGEKTKIEHNSRPKTGFESRENVVSFPEGKRNIRRFSVKPEIFGKHERGRRGEEDSW